MRNKLVFSLIVAVHLLCGCSGREMSLQCEERRCDTLNNYFFIQSHSDVSIHHNLTYLDTVILKRNNGQMQFTAFICNNCKGTEYAKLLSENNKTVKEIRIDYNGKVKSEEFDSRDILPYADQILKFVWSQGKTIYIKQQ